MKYFACSTLDGGMKYVLNLDEVVYMTKDRETMSILLKDNLVPQKWAFKDEETCNEIFDEIWNRLKGK